MSICERYIPENATEIKDDLSDAVVYTYTNGAGRPSAIGFHGKARKSDFHHWFRSEEARQRHINDFLNARRGRAKMMADRKSARLRPHTLEVGHILVASWGYEQTNVDFYEVTKVTGARTVEIREIGSNIVSGDGHAGKVIPASGQYTGPAMRKQVDGNEIKVGPRAWARIWDGLPKSFNSNH